MKLVKKTRTGNIVWKDAVTRNRAIYAELRRRGYNMNVDAVELGNKFYIARTGITVTNQVERTFRTQSAIDKHLRNWHKRDWNKYERNCDSIEVIDRDVIAEYAAERMLG